MNPPFGQVRWFAPTEVPIEVLIVAPHPDDEVIGPGGYAALNEARGVAALVLSDGARGAAGDSKTGLAARREQESCRGLVEVGARAVWFARLPSRVIQDPGDARAAEAVAFAVRSFRPGVVLVTAPFERHPTHQATTRATLRGARAAGYQGRLLGYPVWDGLVGEAGVERIDIGPVIERKLRAVRCHESQLAARAFDDAVRCRNRLDALLFATTGGSRAEFVECFVDLSELLPPTGPTLGRWMRRRIDAALISPFPADDEPDA